jgi:hypothetical protein
VYRLHWYDEVYLVDVLSSRLIFHRVSREERYECPRYATAYNDIPTSKFRIGYLFHNTYVQRNPPTICTMRAYHISLAFPACDIFHMSYSSLFPFHPTASNNVFEPTPPHPSPNHPKHPRLPKHPPIQTRNMHIRKRQPRILERLRHSPTLLRIHPIRLSTRLIHIL